jgi:hypothetical protein
MGAQPSARRIGRLRLILKKALSSFAVPTIYDF